MSARALNEKKKRHTWDQGSVGERVHGPDVRCPVSVAQPSREREKSVLQLEQLAPLDERSKSNGKHAEHTNTELDDVSKTRP